ncbi:hypothetical protein [Streptomyces lavendulae]|uniref:hypothetical protein n=1 Tax=Streptomyces lavendulae TaxID=1914 RepID=UPI0036E4A392
MKMVARNPGRCSASATQWRFSMFTTVVSDMTSCLVPILRWNKNGMGRAALTFLRVVAGQQRDGLASDGVAADDGRDDGEELSGHRDDALPVALRGSDHQQGDDLTVGSLVLPNAEMGEFQGLFYAHA